MSSHSMRQLPVTLFSRMLVMILAVLALADVALLVSGRCILLGETKVSPRQTYVVGVHGGVGRNEQASLVCRYFTGRTVLTKVYWYPTDTVMGQARCPYFAAAE